MDTIQFFVVEFINTEFDSHRFEIQIYINGHDLMDLVERIEHAVLNPQNLDTPFRRSYAGLNPEWRPNLRNEFLGNTRESYSVLLTCTCHEDWCNSILARIVVDSHKVTWRDFTNVLYGDESRFWGGTPIDYSALGPFEFDKKQYLEALDTLELDK